MKKLAALFLLAASLFAGKAPAQFKSTPPNIQGRWEIVTTSGSLQAQPFISTYLLQSGGNITSIQPLNFDAFDANTVNYDNNTLTGVIDDSGQVGLLYTFKVGNTSFQYAFAGTLGKQDGAKIITGSYTTDDLADSDGAGNFVATFFPDWNSPTTYAGSLEDASSTGPTGVPLTYTLQTLPNHTVKVSNVALGAPLNGCFIPPFTTIDSPELPLIPTAATGAMLEIWLKDSVGGILYISGYPVEPDGFSSAALDEYQDPTVPLPTNLANLGTNNEYVIAYSITSNNSCNGYGGGGEAPFVVKNTENEGHKNRKHGRSE